MRKLPSSATFAKMVIDRYLQNRPVEEHFLAYGLLGRMAMHKAEQTEIPSKERRAAYAGSATAPKVPGWVQRALRSRTRIP